MTKRQKGHLASRPVFFSPGQCFSCMNCGKCCKLWDVPLSSREKDSISKLAFSSFQIGKGDFFLNDPKRRNVFLLKKIGGRCIFLGEDELCMIHKEFGESAKPLACRAYPFDVFNWVDGSVSASLRHDCPSVANESGKPMASHEPFIRKLADETAESTFRMNAPYSRAIRPPIAKLRTIASAYSKIFSHSTAPFSLKILGAASLLEFHSRKENSHDIEEFEESFVGDASALFERSLAELERSMKNPCQLDLRRKILFRYIVNGFLRSDEASKYGTGLIGRCRRTISLLKFCLGSGGASELIGAAGKIEEEDPVLALNCEILGKNETERLQRFVQTKIQSLHFCGFPSLEHSFEEGMMHLLMSLPAASAISAMISCEDRKENAFPINRALMLTDHTFSRSPFFALGWTKRIEKEFCRPPLLSSLLGPFVNIH